MKLGQDDAFLIYKQESANREDLETRIASFYKPLVNKQTHTQKQCHAAIGCNLARSNLISTDDVSLQRFLPQAVSL
jgi:hypothetical protein